MSQTMQLRRDLARALNEALRSKPWSQAEIARELGTTQSRVSYVQRGIVDSIRTDQIIEWLAILGHTIEVKVSSAEASVATERREDLLLLGREALARGDVMGAHLWARVLWSENPRYPAAGALLYDALMARGFHVDAVGYKPYKDQELAGSGGTLQICAINSLDSR